MKKLEIGEIVRLIGDVKKTDSGIWRFEAETVVAADAEGAAQKGWVSLQGQQGKHFFRLSTRS